MHNAAHPPFGDRLRRYRVAAGLSQEALAERAGVAARTIGAIEQGTSTAPYKDTVQCLADALAVPHDERAAFVAISRYRRPRSNPAAATPRLAPSTLPAPPTVLTGHDGERDGEPHFTLPEVGGAYELEPLQRASR